MEISFEEVKKRLEEYGEYELSSLGLWFGFNAKDEGRQPTEDEIHLAYLAAWLYKQVEEQMMHLADICKEPIQNPAQLDKEEMTELYTYLGDHDADEKIAARAFLVKLHKPTPENLSGEEIDNWYDEQRSEFVALINMTVAEAINYVSYWEQEREGTEAMLWFANEWHIAREVEEVTGGDPPNTIGEFIGNLDKRAREEEEEESS